METSCSLPFTFKMIVFSECFFELGDRNNMTYLSIDWAGYRNALVTSMAIATSYAPVLSSPITRKTNG